MNQDSIERMVKDGKGMDDILQSVPEEKRGIVRMLIDTYINGFLARGYMNSDAVRRSGT